MLLRVEDGRVVARPPLPARPLVRRGDDPPLRARPARGRVLPQAARRDRARGRLAGARPTRPARPRRLRRGAARERGTGTRPTPAGRRSSGRPATRSAATSSARRASAQSAIFGSRPSARASVDALLDRPLEPLLPHRHVEAGLAQSACASEPNVCQSSDFDGIAPLRASMSRAVGVRPSSSPSARRRPSSSSRVANRRGTSPACALRRVPAAEVLDHRLRVHGRLRVGRELAHRRRAPEPLGAVLQLLQDLFVGVPLPDARLERRQRVRIDACHRWVAAGSSHASSVEHHLRFARAPEQAMSQGQALRTWPKRPRRC